MGAMLAAAMKAVDWSGNVSVLCQHGDLATRIEGCNLRISLWARQIEGIEGERSAIAFIREMQNGAHNVACCMSLALYKPAASAMRSLVECALYYSYFRTHPAELRTLVSGSKYYVSKKEIHEFFQRHVPGFNDRQSAINYSDRLDKWYSATSSIVHGQIPGDWNTGTSVQEIRHSDVILEKAVSHFEDAAILVQDTFLCVLAYEIWNFVESDAKNFICKGMSGNVKAAFGLDAA